MFQNCSNYKEFIDQIILRKDSVDDITLGKSYGMHAGIEAMILLGEETRDKMMHFSRLVDDEFSYRFGHDDADKKIPRVLSGAILYQQYGSYMKDITASNTVVLADFLMFSSKELYDTYVPILADNQLLGILKKKFSDEFERCIACDVIVRHYYDTENEKKVSGFHVGEIAYLKTHSKEEVLSEFPSIEECMDHVHKTYF